MIEHYKMILLAIVGDYVYFCTNKLLWNISSWLRGIYILSGGTNDYGSIMLHMPALRKHSMNL